MNGGLQSLNESEKKLLAEFFAQLARMDARRRARLAAESGCRRRPGGDPTEGGAGAAPEIGEDLGAA